MKKHIEQIEKAATEARIRNTEAFVREHFFGASRRIEKPKSNNMTVEQAKAIVNEYLDKHDNQWPVHDVVVYSKISFDVPQTILEEHTFWGLIHIIACDKIGIKIKENES